MGCARKKLAIAWLKSEYQPTEYLAYTLTHAAFGVCTKPSQLKSYPIVEADNPLPLESMSIV